MLQIYNYWYLLQLETATQMLLPETRFLISGSLILGSGLEFT